MFSAANFPARRPTDITQAQNLYAMLTGRITSITGERAHQRGGRHVRAARQIARRGPDARVRLLSPPTAGAPRRC
jgi:hypothetical protein